MKSLQQSLIRLIEFLLAASLLAIALIIVTLVVLRYCFNSSATGANECVTILFAYATSLGAAVAIARDEHISISFAADMLPSSLQVQVQRLVILLVAFLNIVMVVESVSWIHITGDYLMPATGMPRKLAQLCVPLGCGLAAWFCFLRLPIE